MYFYPKYTTLLRKATKNLWNQLQCCQSIDFPRCSQHWAFLWVLDVRRYYFLSNRSTISICEKVAIPRNHSTTYSHLSSLQRATLCRWEIATLGFHMSNLEFGHPQCRQQGH